jgi:hypothetical protein
MNPPAGRIVVGDHVIVPGGRRGQVAGERLVATNGAWRYVVALEGGGTAEYFDFELNRAAPA